MISTVEMYKKVPTEIETKIPTNKGPYSDNSHPIPIPIGFIIAWIRII